MEIHMAKQNISIGNVKMSKSSMSINQTSFEGGSNSEIITKTDFANQLERFISTLSSSNSKDAQLIDAIADLKNALEEVKKPKPAPSSVRRFLNNAATLLNDIKDFVVPASAIAAGLKTLVDIIPQILK
jgi:uncharacterized coiled-coil DUF342 family protein